MESLTNKTWQHSSLKLTFPNCHNILSLQLFFRDVCHIEATVVCCCPSISDFSVNNPHGRWAAPTPLALWSANACYEAQETQAIIGDDIGFEDVSMGGVLIDDTAVFYKDLDILNM